MLGHSFRGISSTRNQVILVLYLEITAIVLCATVYQLRFNFLVTVAFSDRLRTEESARHVLLQSQLDLRVWPSGRAVKVLHRDSLRYSDWDWAKDPTSDICGKHQQPGALPHDVPPLLQVRTRITCSKTRLACWGVVGWFCVRGGECWFVCCGWFWGCCRWWWCFKG